MEHLGSTRRDAIRRQLGLWGSVRTSELCERLGVSERTIQRDYDAILVEVPGIKRVYGGLVATSRDDQSPLRVGLLVPSPDYYFDDVIAGAQQSADQLNVRLIMADHRYQDDLELLLLQRFGEVRLDGLVATVEHDATRHQRLSRFAVPTVVLERPWPPQHGVPDRDGEAIDHVFSDHAAGAALGLRHLADLGHQSIRCLFRRTPTTSALLRGVSDTAAVLGGDGTTVRTTALAEAATRGDRHWRRAIGGAVRQAVGGGMTAFFAHSDPVAVDLLEALRGAGIDVPGQVSVLTYDGSRLAATAELTAVAPRRHAVGAVAVERIVDRLRNSGQRTSANQHGYRISLVPELVVRGTTATPARS